MKQLRKLDPKEEMEDTIQESHELAGVFTSIAGLMEHLLPERGTL